MKKQLIAMLRDTASVLEPLTEEVVLGAKRWNGTEYKKVERAEEERHLNPYALAWWSRLNTIADLLELQETSPTPGQQEYIKRILFGGMGSLTDFFIDPHTHRNNANVNRTLKAKLGELFEVLRS
jgi:hypothetical protein